MNSASNINCFELSSKIFDKVAYNVATDWSRLGRYLDLTNEEIAMIDSDYGKTHEKANQVLVKWRQKIGNVTWQQLKKNLESIERFDIIRQIEKDLIGILTRPGTIGGENTQLSIISGEKAQPAKSRVADKKSLLQNPGVDGIRNYKIPPYFYVHILDQNTNVARVEVGPQNYICHDNENYIFGPYPMVTIPTHHYCIIENPVIYYENVVDLDLNGQARIKYGELEVRFTQDPFPLYPGEVVKQSPIPFTVLEANTALHLRAAMLFSNNDGKKYVAGDEWLFEGPGTYIPRKEVDVIKKIHATIIKHNQAIKLRARRETKDRYGTKRVTGEEWLFRKMCAYLPDVFEEVIEVLDAYILTEKIALHMKATRTFFDDRFENKKKRKNGEEWLITSIDTENHIPNVYEQIVTIVNITTLNNRQFCVVCDPVDADGKPQLGFKKLVKGKKSFFLQPGESLENGIQNVFVLSEHESLILKATKKFIDDDNECAPGDIWMIQGPCEYVPPVEVEVCCVRKAITLDANEGVYVRNIKTGKVRAVIGCTYMLNQDEELWQKELPPVVEDLLSSGMNSLEDRSDRKWITEKLIARDKTKVVVYRVPYNAAVQIYDYKEKKSRIVFGSDVVMLEPHEQFTVLSISGGIPKQPNAIKALCLFLGPDFATDIVDVKTADHVQLSLQLSYNWNFDKSNGELLFSVPDFIGNACKTIASRIRGAVATLKFFDFHKNYAQIIRSAVFGLDDNKEVRKNYTFSLNNLNITSVDIHSVEAVTNILE